MRKFSTNQKYLMVYVKISNLAREWFKLNSQCKNKCLFLGNQKRNRWKSAQN